MRILVTGSREWTDRDRLEAELRESRQMADLSEETLVVVHGDCPEGADRMARDWCHRGGVKDEPHPADWARYGKPAGYKRNAEMVNLGADICLAFVTPGCRGTVHCAALAQSALIPVYAFFASK